MSKRFAAGTSARRKLGAFLFGVTRGLNRGLRAHELQIVRAALATDVDVGTCVAMLRDCERLAADFRNWPTDPAAVPQYLAALAGKTKATTTTNERGE
ncbi:MAG: hypothetical protein WD825_17140 [Gemmatimonadaceae bacterium]